ncbi:unnamed protein product [Lampetra planeri]
MCPLLGQTLLLLLLLHVCALASGAASSPGPACDRPLGSPLGPGAYGASSELSPALAAHFARLNSREGAGGWAPSPADPSPWLQLDLGGRSRVTAVATQGRYGSSEWVARYQLLHSDTGSNWKRYQRDDNLWAFGGNENSDGRVRHELPRPLVTRFLRFAPLDPGTPARIGLRVAVYGCPYTSDVAHLDGRSALAYRFAHKSMRTLKDAVALRFKTAAADGVLLHGEGQQGDFLTLAVHRARLQLHLNLGSRQQRAPTGHTSVTVGTLLDDQHWHSVSLHRHGRHVNLTLDGHTRHLRTNGDFDYLDLDYQLSFGGLSTPGKGRSSFKRNFQGCLENVSYNGVNLIDLAKRRKPAVYITGNVSFACAEPRVVPITFPLPGSSLWLWGPAWHEALSVVLELRTWSARGTLVYTAFSPAGPRASSLSIGLDDGRLTVTLLQPGRDALHLSAGSDLNDGQWHSVSVSLRRNFVGVTLDGDEASAIQSYNPLDILTGDVYYLGGCPAVAAPGQCRAPHGSFLGCLRSVRIAEQDLDMSLVEQGMLGNFTGAQLNTCGILDRCLPNHCEHGGQCSQEWDSFFCDCDGTGYLGDTCHNPVFERSCEAYKHLGGTSGFYHIDLDGSGPLDPLLVNCNVTEERVWTVLSHDGTDERRVPETSTALASFVARFVYNASSEQLSALVEQAEQCRQEVAYYCRRSRLLNSPDGPPFTWWVSRTNERQHYWGGSSPGVQKCACGVERNCTEEHVHCNCDADRDEWMHDSGWLTNKEHLPVTQLVIGDANRSRSAASYLVGPLRCHGDKHFWNAASFSNRTAYLLFPTFRGEKSADISFYFKTVAPFGTFLENLGLQHFLRLELKSPLEVSMRFDVGDGPVELIAVSPWPLNDDQWHRVCAERNVKRASLQVDELPRRVRRSPPDGHTRLRLNSQLFVGATASGKRGFLGCLRALQMNGATLSLEERARSAVGGVNPGCTGHCSSYGSLCRNGGRCVERYSGYTCDCTHTPFDGPFCTQEVGAYFEAGTVVQFSLDSESSREQSVEEDEQAEEEEGTMAAVASSLGRDDLDEERAIFSFSTVHAPAVLLHASTHAYPSSYLAIVLEHNGNLQLWFGGGGTSSPRTVSAGMRNLADGQVHAVNVTRRGTLILLQLDHYLPTAHRLPAGHAPHPRAADKLYLGRVPDEVPLEPEVAGLNWRGFGGCLSRVQYNGRAPLKAALRQGPHSSLVVTVTGRLVPSSCAAVPQTVAPVSPSTPYPWAHQHEAEEEEWSEDPVSTPLSADSIVIGGAIAASSFVILAVLVLITRYVLRHKGTYHTHEVKGSDAGGKADAISPLPPPPPPPPPAVRTDESPREWFI